MHHGSTKRILTYGGIYQQKLVFLQGPVQLFVLTQGITTIEKYYFIEEQYKFVA